MRREWRNSAASRELGPGSRRAKGAEESNKAEEATEFDWWQKVDGREEVLAVMLGQGCVGWSAGACAIYSGSLCAKTVLAID